MARFYLANDVRVGSRILRVGKLVDDAVVSASLVSASGGILIPETPEVAAAAALVTSRRRVRAISDEEASDLFLSTVIPLADGAAASWFAATSPIVAGPDGVVTSAFPMTTVTGAPLLVEDNIAGGFAVRTGVGDRLAMPAGLVPYLVTGECTIHFVVRYRTSGTSTNATFFDTTDGGTRKGIQVQLNDSTATLGRSVVIRQFDGSTFTNVTDTTFQPGPGVYFPQNWCVGTIRMTSTLLDIRINGQFVWAGSIAFTKPYLDEGPGAFAMGDGPFDFKAWVLFKEWRTDAKVAATEAKLSTTCNARLISLVAGDPALLGGRFKSASFPYPSRLPDGRFYMTIYMGIDGPVATDHNDSYVSTDGITWTFWKVETQSTDALRYSDLKTSEPLSDGSIIQVTFTYDSGDTTQPLTIWRRSTDGAATWSEWADANPGVTPNQSFVSEAPREDPTQLGHLHMPVQTFETSGDASTRRSKLWDYVTSDAGATWARTLVADGVADSKFYAEPGERFTAAGELRMMIRDATVNGTSPMLQAHSPAGDHGATWSSPVDANVPGWSSGQQVRILASGREVFIVRQLGSDGKAAIFWRAAGAAADDPWEVTKFDVDPTWGGMYYAGILEPTPGRLVLVYARSGHINVGFNNSVGAQVIEEWMLDHAWPGSATPDSGTVTAGGELVIALLGAGDFSVVTDSMGSGGSVVVSGSRATYAVGPANGTDDFHFVDILGKTCATCSFIVTGGTNAPSVTSVVPDVGTAAGGTNVTITGTGFVGSTGATVGGVALTSFAVVNPTTITGTTAAGAAVANADVVVTNGAPGTLTGAWTYLPSGYVLHHRGDFVTKTGSNILSVADISGSGNTATPPSFNPQAAVLDGKPAVQFVGGSDFLSYASFTAGLTAMDFFAVCQNDDDGVTAVAAFAYTDDSVQTNFTPLSNRALYDNTGTTVRNDAVLTPAAGAWSSPWMYEVVSTSSEWTATFNREAPVTNPVNVFGYQAVQRLGAGLGAAYQGRVAEVLMWPAKLSAPNNAVVAAYLRARYPSLP